MTTNSPAPRSRALFNTLIVALGYLASRVLGVVRDMFITAQFGTSPLVDAYRAAFAIPDLLYLVVAGGALGTALIPVFQQRRHDAGSDEAGNLASSVLNLMLPCLVSISVMAWIWALPLVQMTTAHGFPPATQQLTADLMRMLLLQPILLGIGGIFKAVLEAHEQFSIPTLGSNLYNLGIIFGAAVLARWYGIHGVIYGVLIGAAAFTLVQIPALRRVTWRYAANAWVHTVGLVDVGKLLLPRLFGQSIWQINLASMIAITSSFGVGAVAAAGYAMQVMLLPHGLVGLSVGTVIFPRLARLAARGEHEQFGVEASQALQSVLAVALPASVVLWYAPELVVLVLYQRGSFDAASAQLTVAALRGYALGLAGFSVAEIAVRIWFALKNTRVPVIVGAGAVALNLGLGWWLSLAGTPIERLSATATVFSIANTAEAVVLLWWLMRHYASIRIFTKSWMWLVGIGGMVVLLQVCTPFLPGLPTHNLHNGADWLRVALYAGFYGICGVWGIGWCSQWFAVLRATRRPVERNNAT